MYCTFIYAHSLRLTFQLLWFFLRYFLPSSPPPPHSHHPGSTYLPFPLPTRSHFLPRLTVRFFLSSTLSITPSSVFLHNIHVNGESERKGAEESRNRGEENGKFGVVRCLPRYGDEVSGQKRRVWGREGHCFQKEESRIYYPL